MSQQIFISYAHDDKIFVDELTTELQKSSFSLWIDSEKLRAGRDWRTGIDDGIRNSFALIVIMTPKAKSSEYVTYEWAFALGIGLLVIPVMYIPTSLHPRLEVLQYLDFTDATRRVYSLLISQLEEYQLEYGLKQNTKVALIKDSLDGAMYLLDQHNRARKVPDYDTLTFLKEILGFTNDGVAVLSEEIAKIRGEQIIAVRDWHLKRPKTDEEDRERRAQRSMTIDWHFYEQVDPQKLILQIQNSGDEALQIRKIKFQPNSLKFVDRELDSSYIRRESYVYIAETLQVSARDSLSVDIALSRAWSDAEIGRLRSHIGFIIMELDFEGHDVSTIHSL